mgnify:CR=1 FL=1
MSRRGLSAFRSLLKFNATNNTRKVCDVKGVSRQLFFFNRFFFASKKEKKKIGKKVQKLDDDDEKEATFITTHPLVYLTPPLHPDI